MPRIPLFLAACLLLAACATRPSSPAPAPAAATAMVAEAWVSAGSPEDEIDSVAVWPSADGHTWLIATAKSTQRLVVYDADSGARLREFGGPGDGDGRFARPNGIAVFGDLLFVAERDNHRVQVLHLPDFAPRGMIGADVLKVPYGLWLRETAPEQLELFVTDSFMADFRTRTLPPMAQLDQRVKRFSLQLDGDGGPVRGQYLGAFGDITEAGALRMVESIAGDPAHDRLLIADEDVRVGSTLRDYALEGRYRGDSLPPFQADAEGVSLWACDARDGYWIAADQVSPTLFRVYDRASLRPNGSFSGHAVANTDGQALYAASTARFPAGALFVQTDDRGVAAFDLRDIARALHLSPRCAR